MLQFLQKKGKKIILVKIILKVSYFESSKSWSLQKKMGSNFTVVLFNVMLLFLIKTILRVLHTFADSLA